MQFSSIRRALALQILPLFIQNIHPLPPPWVSALSPSFLCPSLHHALGSLMSIYEEGFAASDCAWRAAAFSSLSSPCLPFYMPISLRPISLSPFLCTHLPLGEAEFALAPSLSSNALVLLERAAHDARCDGDVAVVAAQMLVSRPNGGSGTSRFREGVRETGGFPRECHCDGRVRVRRCGRGLGCGCRC